MLATLSYAKNDSEILEEVQKLKAAEKVIHTCPEEQPVPQHYLLLVLGLGYHSDR
jgi:hypothetical protein